VAEYPVPIPLVVSDASALPFQNGVFDLVVSSGMIEHVGVDEFASPYTVHARPEQEELRRLVVSEMVRATADSGVVFIDFPNGSFLIDFWHGDNVGAFRIHGFPDALLPSFRNIKRWARFAGSKAVVQPLSGRLRFRQVGRHWWGRLLSPLMRATIATLDLLSRIGFGWLVATAYPYLVVELRKDETIV
jgi:SAM-dependent methyltransferase